MAWQAFVTIIAIAGIVLVASGIIAFIGHMVINVFDTEKRVDSKPTKEALDFTQYKQYQQEFNAQKEFNYESINAAKAERAKAMAEKTAEDELFNLLEDDDAELAEMENRLKAQAKVQPQPEYVQPQQTYGDPYYQPYSQQQNYNQYAQPINEQPVQPMYQQPVQPIYAEPTTPIYAEPGAPVAEAPQTENNEDFDDDFDIDALIEEIADDVVEEEVETIQSKSVKTDSVLDSYNLDDYLNKSQEELSDLEADDENETEDAAEQTETEVPAKEIKKEIENVRVEADKSPVVRVAESKVTEVKKAETKQEIAPVEKQVQTDIVEEEIKFEDIIDIEDDDDEEILQEVRTFIANKSLPAPPVIIDDRNDAELKAAADTIKGLKAQLESLNQQLEEVRKNKTTVVTVDNMTEEQCLQRLLNLEERLKMVKKDYKVNLKEYRPLKKVMKDLEKFQTKLRRKDAVVAKKKVALYGVNNYVDIDKEKAEKLANELELLDGLRLSVAHCEEVINANKDRFPILERTNDILEKQIAQLEADIEHTNVILQKIRDAQGNGNK